MPPERIVWTVPGPVRPERQDSFATSLDRLAAYLKIKTSFST
jgi:hypothetical protein